MLRRLLLALLLLLPGIATAQTAPAPAKVEIVTTAGRIVLALDRAHAPVTTANFLRYVDAHRLEGTTFYRAMKLGDGSGLVQGGVRILSQLFPPIAHEPTTQTGLTHGEGTISMARNAPGSARADFFITIGNMAGLDANPKAEGDNAGFAAFGQVIEGMDVVHAIQQMPVSDTAGEGVMRGQMLAAPVKILSAKRLP